MKNSGAGDVDLSAATVEWLGPDNGKILRHGDEATETRFNVTAIKDVGDTMPVIHTREDRFRITLDATALTDDSHGLKEGEEFTIKIVTQAGAVTYHHKVPPTLTDQEAVQL
jgi:flagellin FlaA/flagellin FlaB